MWFHRKSGVVLCGMSKNPLFQGHFTTQHFFKTVVVKCGTFGAGWYFVVLGPGGGGNVSRSQALIQNTNLINLITTNGHINLLHCEFQDISMSFLIGIPKV